MPWIKLHHQCSFFEGLFRTNWCYSVQSEKSISHRCLFQYKKKKNIFNINIYMYFRNCVSMDWLIWIVDLVCWLLLWVQYLIMWIMWIHFIIYWCKYSWKIIQLIVILSIHHWQHWADSGIIKNCSARAHLRSSDFLSFQPFPREAVRSTQRAWVRLCKNGNVWSNKDTEITIIWKHMSEWSTRTPLKECDIALMIDILHTLNSMSAFYQCFYEKKV